VTLNSIFLIYSLSASKAFDLHFALPSFGIPQPALLAVGYESVAFSLTRQQEVRYHLAPTGFRADSQ
jgi:hypothetical protein